jgi:hybrid cluster-associated redox disulfide protein
MNTPAVDEPLDTPIEVILGMWPEVSQVFIRNHMGCIGCAFARFHTLQDAFEIYRLDKEVFIGQMRVFMDSKGGLEPSEA